MPLETWIIQMNVCIQHILSCEPFPKIQLWNLSLSGYLSRSHSVLKFHRKVSCTCRQQHYLSWKVSFKENYFSCKNSLKVFRWQTLQKVSKSDLSRKTVQIIFLRPISKLVLTNPSKQFKLKRRSGLFIRRFQNHPMKTLNEV